MLPRTRNPPNPRARLPARSCRAVALGSSSEMARAKPLTISAPRVDRDELREWARRLGASPTLRLPAGCAFVHLVASVSVLVLVLVLVLVFVLVLVVVHVRDFQRHI